MDFDIIIIGGGPAGISAGIYAARKKMKTLLIAKAIGGSSMVSATVENWLGIVTISGWELAQSFEKHLRAQEGIRIVTDEIVKSIESAEGVYSVTIGNGSRYEAGTVIIATGVRHRHLGVPGETEFDGKGVAYCSTCDAPFFKGKRVAVIGGGNCGLEAVEDLLPYATEIVLITDVAELTGDAVLQERILSSGKVSVIYSTRMREIFGSKRVEGLRYEEKETGEIREITVDGVFVEIGMVPNSELATGIVERNSRGEIITNARNMETSCPGIFAAGDVTDMPYRQNGISAGQGAVAALSAYDYMKRKRETISE
ncbi:MAG: FAD-dependent oxidoreductase [Candidatus Moranbacteria bacterium]|nr:FAD-dependent oxidoreductase [Candidatus Moranbacteria bacterium]